jgi:hypothetical protein
MNAYSKDALRFLISTVFWIFSFAIGNKKSHTAETLRG